ncbi:MAG: LamG-like jellyroll fold domain-containing protein [Bacteroidota bacterium]
MKKNLFLLAAIALLSGQILSAQDHHWPLETDLNDVVGILDGTNNGVSFENDAVRGDVCYFNGEGYANLPSFINGNGTDLTVAVWWRMDEKQVWSRIYTFGTGDQSEPKDVMMVIPTSGAVEEGSDPAHNMYRFTLSDPAGWIDADFYKEEVDVALDTWYYSVVVLKPDSVIVYHDNTRILAESGLTSRSIGEMSDVENALGKSFWPDALWKGALSDLRVWNSALTYEEVMALYSSTMPTGVSEKSIDEDAPNVYSYLDKIAVDLNEPYTDEVASVYSITGALIAEKPVPEISQVTFNTGIYIVNVHGSRVNHATKVFVK